MLGYQDFPELQSTVHTYTLYLCMYVRTCSYACMYVHVRTQRSDNVNALCSLKKGIIDNLCMCVCVCAAHPVWLMVVKH
jgi:hypothetical protein